MAARQVALPHTSRRMGSAKEGSWHMQRYRAEMRWRFLGAAVALQAIAPTSGVAQTTNPLDPSPSPGSVALLMAEKVGPAEFERWKQALADPRPETRAAAARVAFVSGATPLVPALLDTLQTETSKVVAGELFLALGELAPGAADDALFEAAARFGGALNGRLVRAIGRRGPEALALAPRLRTLSLDSLSWSAFLRWATREGREGLPDAARIALDIGDPMLWADLLTMALTSREFVPEAILAESLGSAVAGVREATYWHLLRVHSRGKQFRPSTLQLLEETPEAQDRSPDPVAQLAFELLGRSVGQTSTDRTSLIETLPALRGRQLPTDSEVVDLLLETERDAYAQRRYGDEAKRVFGSKRAPRAAVDRRSRRMRTLSALPPGMTKDVMELSGCEPKGNPWVAFQTEYGPRGELTTIGEVPGPRLSDECRTAARVLLIMGFRPVDRAPRPKETDIVMTRLTTESPCTTAPVDSPPPLVPGLVDGAQIEEPRKIHDVKPVFPASARSEKRQGIVILEMVVGPSGCVAEVEVIRGPAPDLEVAALQAVSQWRYRPTLLAGKPVPVRMVVTVNFRFR